MIDKLERKFGKYAIKGLMKYVIVLYVAGFIINAINPPQHKIPARGNQGQNGTLNGLGLSGSIFLKIRIAAHTIINEVNVPKLHKAAAASKFNVIVPIIETIHTTQVKT